MDRRAAWRITRITPCRRPRASGKRNCRQVRLYHLQLPLQHRTPSNPFSEQFRILRKKGTEPPGSGTYDKHYPSAGVYTCGGCESPLYKANHKFDSGCGWPAFWDAVPGAVGQRPDPGLGMMRTEIVCNNCGGHLGHIFKGERFGNPKDERHCVNSISINFSAKDEEGK